MKKIIFTITTVLLLLNTAIAQDALSNKFYFRYAISSPMDGYYNYGDWEIEDFTNKKGGAIEFGSIFYLNSLDLGPKAKLGIDVNYFSASKHTLGGEDFEIDLDFGSGLDFGSISFGIPEYNFYNLGSKVGLLFSYNIWDKLNADIFAKANPIWANIAILDIKEEDSPLTYYTGFMGLKYSFGLNVRYDFIMLGAELNMGKLKYRSEDDKTVYLGDSPTPTSFEDLEDEIYVPKYKETNSPCLNFSVGFCF